MGYVYIYKGRTEDFIDWPLCPEPKTETQTPPKIDSYTNLIRSCLCGNADPRLPPHPTLRSTVGDVKDKIWPRPRGYHPEPSPVIKRTVRIREWRQKMAAQGR